LQSLSIELPRKTQVAVINLLQDEEENSRNM
jgi:hypothetical protein